MHCALTSLLSFAVLLAPSKRDVNGVGIRIVRSNLAVPVFEREAISDREMRIGLLNLSKSNIMYDPLPVARACGDLDAIITDPEGVQVPRLGRPSRRDPFTQQLNLRAATLASEDYLLSDFGYDQVKSIGRHTLEVSLNIAGKRLTSDKVFFQVVRIQKDAVQVSLPIQPSAKDAMPNANERSTAFIQQVRLGGKMYLVFRQFQSEKFGGELSRTVRIMELDGPQEMTVAGVRGGPEPLEVTLWKAGSPKSKQTLVVNSVSGRLLRRD
jgi:hypothetical protein